MPAYCLPIAYVGCGAGAGALTASLYHLRIASKASTPKERGSTVADAHRQHGVRSAGGDSVLLNSFVTLLWPRINEYLRHMVHDSILPSIDGALPEVARGSIKVERLSIGQAPPTFSNISVTLRDDQAIVLDVGVGFSSDLDIKIKAMGVPVGIQSFSFSGTLTVCCRPQTNEPPFFGGLEIYFVNPPELDFDFTGAADVADWNVFRGTIVKTVTDAISRALVLPARIPVDLNPNDDVELIDLHPEPLGVLRLLVKSGRGLRGDDFSFTGARTSDPYVTVLLGQQNWRSSTIKKTTNPTWSRGNMADFLVYDERQEIRVQVFDEDTFSNDDLLGVAKGLRVERFTSQSALPDSVLQLTEKKSDQQAGELTISTRWFQLTDSAPAHGLSTAVAHGPSQMVLCGRFECGSGLLMTDSPPFTVRMSVKTKSRLYTVTSPKCKVQELRTACLSLAQKGTELEEISRAVGVPAKQVEAILNDPVEGKAAVHVTVDSMLRLLLPWTPEMMDAASVVIEVLNSKNKRCGSEVSRRVRAVAAQSDAGPFQFQQGAALAGSLSVKWLCPRVAAAVQED